MFNDGLGGPLHLCRALKQVEKRSSKLKKSRELYVASSFSTDLKLFGKGHLVR